MKQKTILNGKYLAFNDGSFFKFIEPFWWERFKPFMSCRDGKWNVMYDGKDPASLTTFNELYQEYFAYKNTEVKRELIQREEMRDLVKREHI